MTSSRQLNLPRFTFINGPPGSGKSTLASLLVEAGGGMVWRDSFAEPIREMILSVFFPEQSPFAPEIDLRQQKIKMQALPLLAKIRSEAEYQEGDLQNEISVRQTMIDFSEHFMKPRFGSDIFGRLLYKRCEEQSHFYSHFVIDDSGFVSEAEYVLSRAGAQNCFLIRLHREGCDFRGDSRGYITLPDVPFLDLENSSTPAAMLDAIAAELETRNL